MRVLLLSLLTALIAALPLRSAPAQTQISIPLSYIEQAPEQLVEAAFSLPYGRLLIAEFATALGESAGAPCLKTNGLDKAGIEGRAKAMMLRHGAQLVRKYASVVDRAAFKTHFASIAGAGAEAELADLRKNKDVRTFMDLVLPVRDASIVNAVTETLDRNILILKFKLSRRFNPISTGDVKLLGADPSEAAQDKAETFVTASKSAPLKRYVALTTAAQDALNRSIDAKALLGTRIIDLMPGLDKDLADACISRQ